MANFEADALSGTKAVPDNIVPPPCSSIAVLDSRLLAFQKEVSAADLSPVPFKYGVLPCKTT